MGVREAIANLQNITGRNCLECTIITNLPVSTRWFRCGRGRCHHFCRPRGQDGCRGSAFGRFPERHGISQNQPTAALWIRWIFPTIAGPISKWIALSFGPDLVVLAGGTDGGASRSIQKMLEAIGLACYLMPLEKRPMVLYAGNQKLASEVKDLLGGHAGKVEVSYNIRPSLETEDLDPGRHELALLMMKLRERQIKGVEELNLWTAGNLLPTAYARDGSSVF